MSHPSIFPTDLFDGELHAHGDTRWRVLYTKARQEKALARDMHRWGVSFFLPLVRKTKVYKRRKILSEIPLFAGYVFIWGTDDERIKCLTTNRVSRNLEVPDQDCLAYDLRQLKTLIESGAPLTVESRLAPGDVVRIRRGPLAGLEGVVLRRRGECRLLISVNFLQQGASIAIEDYLIEPL